MLREALGALFDQTCPKEYFEVIVVDDGSTDGTGEMIQSLQPPMDLVFIRQAKEGLAAGRNKGILKAKGEIVLFIDDDVLADPALLAEHLRFHELYPKSVVKGWVNHVPVLAKPEKPRWTWRDYSRAFFWTSNVSVQKKYLLEAGLFDESFKEYGWEDLELGLRLQALGLRSKINPKAIGYHYKKSMTVEDVPSMLSQAEAKGRTAVVFVRKNPGWRAKLSTGIHPVRLFLDQVVSSPMFLKLYRRTLSAGASSLSRWGQWCARSLATAHYFKAIRQSLNAK